MIEIIGLADCWSYLKLKEGVILEEGKGIVTETQIASSSRERFYLNLFHVEYRKMEVTRQPIHSSNDVNH
jgi:hypothetical protein